MTHFHLHHLCRNLLDPRQKDAGSRRRDETVWAGLIVNNILGVIRSTVGSEGALGTIVKFNPHSRLRSPSHITDRGLCGPSKQSLTREALGQM